MMWFMGIDIGSAYSKGVIMKDSELAVQFIIPSGANYQTAAETIRRELLKQANLTQADLTFANLSYAKLEGTKLRYALLTRTNLTGANLGGADLGGAQLNKANLTRANLKDAAVNHRQLASASSLDGATMPDGRVYDGDPEPYKA